jgi:hypothetical protein
METVGELKRFFPSSKAEAGACIDATQVASIYALLGEADSAFSWLERAFEERCPFVNGLEHNYLRWVFEGLHADPRFQDLVRRVRSNR